MLGAPNSQVVQGSTVYGDEMLLKALTNLLYGHCTGEETEASW